jgi:hypothetical protein
MRGENTHRWILPVTGAFLQFSRKKIAWLVASCYARGIGHWPVLVCQINRMFAYFLSRRLYFFSSQNCSMVNLKEWLFFINSKDFSLFRCAGRNWRKGRSIDWWTDYRSVLCLGQKAFFLVPRQVICSTIWCFITENRKAVRFILFISGWLGGSGHRSIGLSNWKLLTFRDVFIISCCVSFQPYQGGLK